MALQIMIQAGDQAFGESVIQPATLAMAKGARGIQNADSDDFEVRLPRWNAFTPQSSRAGS